MKLLLIATILVLPVSLVTPGWADEPGADFLPNSSPNSSTSSVNHSSPAQTLAPLSVDSRNFADPQANRSNHLSEQAQQINSNLDTQQPPRPQILNEFLNLPDGMVIRGSSRGGIGIGREY